MFTTNRFIFFFGSAIAAWAETEEAVKTSPIVDYIFRAWFPLAAVLICATTGYFVYRTLQTNSSHPEREKGAEAWVEEMTAGNGIRVRPAKRG